MFKYLSKYFVWDTVFREKFLTNTAFKNSPTIKSEFAGYEVVAVLQINKARKKARCFITNGFKKEKFSLNSMIFLCPNCVRILNDNQIKT